MKTSPTCLPTINDFKLHALRTALAAIAHAVETVLEDNRSSYVRVTSSEQNTDLDLVIINTETKTDIGSLITVTTTPGLIFPVFAHLPNTTYCKMCDDINSLIDFLDDTLNISCRLDLEDMLKMLELDAEAQAVSLELEAVLAEKAALSTDEELLDTGPDDLLAR